MSDLTVDHALRITRLEPEHLLTIDLQPSQQRVLGLPGEMSRELAEAHADQACAWALLDGSRPVACLGIIETFEGQQGFAWAILAAGIGRHHHRLTRLARQLLRECPLGRVEAYTSCSDIEPLAAAFPQFDPWALTCAALEAPTPEMRWAMLIGFKPAIALRRYGASGETVMLFERLS